MSFRFLAVSRVSVIVSIGSIHSAASQNCDASKLTLSGLNELIGKVPRLWALRAHVRGHRDGLHSVKLLVEAVAERSGRV